MAARVNGYRRLPGRDASLIHRSELWLGADHLLRVDMQGVTETYRRFYFGDIQAIIVRTTRQWIGEVIATSVVPVPLLALALFSVGELAWLWYVPFGLAVLGLLVVLARGKSCECYLKTAVQMDRLSSLKRLRTARQFIALVKPLIEQAQGTLAAADYQQRLQTLGAPTTAAPPVIASARRPVPARILRHSRGRLHLAVCLLLLGDAVHSAVELVAETETLDTIGLILFFAMLGLCVVTVVRQANTDLPGSLKRLAWIVMVYFIVIVLVGIGYAITWMMTHPGGSISQMSEENDLVMFALTAVSLLCSTALVASGLLMLRRWWQLGRPAPPTLPATEAGA